MIVKMWGGVGLAVPDYFCKNILYFFVRWIFLKTVMVIVFWNPVEVFCRRPYDMILFFLGWITIFVFDIW